MVVLRLRRSTRPHKPVQKFATREIQPSTKRPKKAKKPLSPTTVSADDLLPSITVWQPPARHQQEHSSQPSPPPPPPPLLPPSSLSESEFIDSDDEYYEIIFPSPRIMDTIRAKRTAKQAPGLQTGDSGVDQPAHSHGVSVIREPQSGEHAEARPPQTGPKNHQSITGGDDDGDSGIWGAK